MKEFFISDLNICVFNCENLDCNITEKYNDGEKKIINFSFVAEDFFEKIKIIIPFHMEGILSTFSPSLDFKRERNLMQWFNPKRTYSNYYYGVPCISAIRNGNVNFATVALSECFKDSAIDFYVDDFSQKEEVKFAINLLLGREKVKEYSVDIKIDLRKISLSKVYNDLHVWFNEYYPEEKGFSPFAEYPLYSTWYNFHQHPNAKLLEKELLIGKEIGLKNVIIDDGWQFDGNGTSDYINCGDWAFSREKFDNIIEFIDKVHDLDMKVMLWFPVPFVGYNTATYKKFRDKLLYEEDGNTNAGILDPRYLDVREHITTTFVDFFKRYDLDGLKLDFIDSFKITDDTPSYNSKMDIESLDEAVDSLLRGIKESLQRYKEDVVIEFRQNYIGPAIVKNCNMLRVMDCAFDSVTNRMAVCDLKLLNYNLAIHSDMLYWAKDEVDENVVRQLLNIIFSVPQISVLLTETKRSHINILRSFLEYWESNKKILLHGNMEFEGLDCNYSVVSCYNENKRITVLYELNDCEYIDGNLDIINATDKTYIIIDNKKELLKAMLIDFCGYKKQEISLQKGINKIVTKIGDRIEIRK